MAKFSGVYDANVLYPAPLRDLLMRLALTDLFKARWTAQIHDEWIEPLLRQGKYRREQLEHVRSLMDAHVRDALVTGYEPLIEGLSLAEPDDRHVLAAAIQCGADAIVTFNQKDFPEEALKSYAIDVIHPDHFVYYQLDLSPPICCKAIRAQRVALKNPKVDVGTFLSTLQKQQLPQTVSKQKEFIEFL